MRKNKLTFLLVSALLTAGMSAGAIAAETLTASTQTVPVSEAATQLANAFITANGDEALIIEAIQAAVAAGMNPDEILALAVANGIDPAIVAANLEDAQTAGGGAFGAAPSPGGTGFGGGSGGGAGTISSN
jgi:ABC-type Fe3+-hydroxamate transport system substrate-binding protein